jgi:ABC-type oligopeptide transport system substrate-binding subunit
MKKLFLKPMLAAALLLAAAQLPACKSKPKDTQVATDSAKTDTVTTAPVTVSPDAELTKNTTDAVKDFPGVTAAVNNGEITLTGNITRERLQKLMMSLNALHPKKINNNLTISK